MADSSYDFVGLCSFGVIWIRRELRQFLRCAWRKDCRYKMFSKEICSLVCKTYDEHLIALDSCMPWGLFCFRTYRYRFVETIHHLLSSRFFVRMDIVLQCFDGGGLEIEGQCKLRPE